MTDVILTGVLEHCTADQFVSVIRQYKQHSPSTRVTQHHCSKYGNVMSNFSNIVQLTYDTAADQWQCIIDVTILNEWMDG